MRSRVVAVLALWAAVFMFRDYGMTNSAARLALLVFLLALLAVTLQTAARLLAEGLQWASHKRRLVAQPKAPHEAA